MEDPLPCMNVWGFFLFLSLSRCKCWLDSGQREMSRKEMGKLRVFLVLVCQSLIRPV